jgi:hypothetical protein
MAFPYPRDPGCVPPPLAVFSAGGVGRGIAWLAVGAPQPSFVMLNCIKLGPPSFGWLLSRAGKDKL